MFIIINKICMNRVCVFLRRIINCRINFMEFTYLIYNYICVSVCVYTHTHIHIRYYIEKIVGLAGCGGYIYVKFKCGKYCERMELKT